MRGSFLLSTPAIVVFLVGGMLMWSALITSLSAETEPTGCIYDREAFNAIRNQARLSHQVGRHDRAAVLNFAAAILRCQPEELEQALAEAMSEVWNHQGDKYVCPYGYSMTKLTENLSMCCPSGYGESEKSIDCYMPVLELGH